MIRQKITLPNYGNWEIYAYYATTRYAVDEIMERLWEIGIDATNARQAFENLTSGKLDTGLCYSNYSSRKSVLVVALTSSPDEFLNSLTHESTHACVHIATALGVNHKSEDFAYMVGDLCQEMYPKVNHLLCDCCRNKEYYDE
jgi:hypothetical protein